MYSGFNSNTQIKSFIKIIYEFYMIKIIFNVSKNYEKFCSLINKNIVFIKNNFKSIFE